MRSLFLAIVIFVSSFCQLAYAEVDGNENKMTEAARQLKWILPENRAYLLVKTHLISTSESAIGVIFGYADNAAACKQIAVALTNPPGHIGRFRCSPIF